MSRSLNRAQIIGNLGADPDLRALASGMAVCRLSVATSESWNDKNTGEAREETEWHRVTLWGKVAEIASQYLHKGDKVFVEGKIRTRKWQDQSGQDRYSTEIHADNLLMLGGRPTDTAAGAYAPQPAYTPPPGHNPPPQRPAPPRPAPAPQRSHPSARAAIRPRRPRMAWTSTTTSPSEPGDAPWRPSTSSAPPTFCGCTPRPCAAAPAGGRSPACASGAPGSFWTWIWRSGCARNMINPRERRYRNSEMHQDVSGPGRLRGVAMNASGC